MVRLFHVDRGFNADEFVAQVTLGEFDGRLVETLKALTTEQLQEVAILMAERVKRPDPAK